MVLSNSSSQQLAAAEIVDRKQDEFEIVPPDPGRDVEGSLQHGRQDLHKHRQPVIIIQRPAVVAVDALRQ
jgi:hypothetical protein